MSGRMHRYLSFRPVHFLRVSFLAEGPISTWRAWPPRAVLRQTVELPFASTANSARHEAHAEDGGRSPHAGQA